MPCSSIEFLSTKIFQKYPLYIIKWLNNLKCFWLNIKLLSLHPYLFKFYNLLEGFMEIITHCFVPIIKKYTKTGYLLTIWIRCTMILGYYVPLRRSHDDLSHVWIVVCYWNNNNLFHTMYTVVLNPRILHIQHYII
jgi:hypothetical protein